MATYKDAIAQEGAEPQPVHRPMMGPFEGLFVAWACAAICAFLVWLVLYVRGQATVKNLEWVVIAPVLPVALVALLLFLAAISKPIVWGVETLLRRDINRDGTRGKPQPAGDRDRLHLVTYHPYGNAPAPPLIVGRDGTEWEPDDLRTLIGRLSYQKQEGWTIRELRGFVLPVAQIAMDDKLIQAFTGGVLEAHGFLVGKSERAKGRLTAEPDQIRAALGL